MKDAQLQDLDILQFGNEIAMWGVIYSGKGQMFMMPFPDADTGEIPKDPNDVRLITMCLEEWAELLQQTDIINVKMANKAIVRKSQRRIDNNISWAVFERDGYKCRYCGQKKPLTVDHIDLWEDGGATVPANLIAACGPCNKTRGRMKYGDWLKSAEYANRSQYLPAAVGLKNIDVLKTLPYLESIRVDNSRTRK